MSRPRNRAVALYSMDGHFNGFASIPVSDVPTRVNFGPGQIYELSRPGRSLVHSIPSYVQIDGAILVDVSVRTG